MLKNYFKSAWRSLWKNRLYTLLNITGLSIGLTIGILILLWVQDEKSFDGFHPQKAETYELIAHIGTGNSRQIWEGTPAPIAVFGKKEIPAIRNFVRITNNWDFYQLSYGEKKLSAPRMLSVDSSFFSVFHFPLVKGDKTSVFKNPGDIVISETFAKSLFGKNDPIGKVIATDTKEHFTVTAVMQDIPENSSIRADVLFSTALIAATYKGQGYWKSMDTDWGDYYYHTFILLPPGSQPEKIAQQLTAIHRRNQKEAAGNEYTLRPLSKLHLTEVDGTNAAEKTVNIFMAVGWLILLIACINYINLATARAMSRSKEVSMRKIIGAGRLQLFFQFMLESGILFCLAAMLALIFTTLLLPMYNQLSGKQLHLGSFSQQVAGILGYSLLFVLVVAGIYPALLLSSFKPLASIKGKLGAGISMTRFRQALVILQFSFSMILITGTLIFGKQLQYIREKQLGYDRTQTFSFPLRDMQKQAASVKDALLAQSSVLNVSFANQQIVNVGNTTGDTDWDGKAPGQQFMIHSMAIDKDFLSLFKVQLAEGENFKGVPADSAHYILNETAVRNAGISNPIGKRFSLHDKPGTIVGVIKDIHISSLRQKIEPTIFYYRPDAWLAYVKTTGKDASRAIAAVEKLWKQYNADVPFSYSFLDEQYNNLYKTDQRNGVLFRLFSVVAIVISCLGLFGLATYTAQVKTKEIGIRKVLGASVLRITALLNRQFIVLVLIAIFIAVPVAWYAMHRWLQDFVYRISISYWLFVAAAAIALLIALLTVSIQTIRAAIVNPVKSLKTE